MADPSPHQRAAGHDRLSAELRAPGADVPPAIAAGAPGQHRLSAAPIATAPVPAGLRRLRQGVLPRVPANPRTLIYPHSHRDTAHSRTEIHPGSPRSPCAIGGTAGEPGPVYPLPWSVLRGEGWGVRATISTRCRAGGHKLPIKRILPSRFRPASRSCSTACTGFSRHHPSRAPPPLARQGQPHRAPLARRPIAGQHHLHGGAGRACIGR